MSSEAHHIVLVWTEECFVVFELQMRCAYLRTDFLYLLSAVRTHVNISPTPEPLLGSPSRHDDRVRQEKWRHLNRSLRRGLKDGSKRSTHQFWFPKENVQPLKDSCARPLKHTHAHTHLKPLGCASGIWIEVWPTQREGRHSQWCCQESHGVIIYFFLRK